MRRALLLLAAALGVVLVPQAPRAAPADACGLSDAKPLWIDFSDGTVPWGTEVFGRPGVVIATPGEGLPPQFRALGAGTVYWEMKLGSTVGTTTAPADPSLIAPRAQTMFDKAVARSGCATPLMALNELNGAGTTTPWSPTNSRYRQNVLDLLRFLAEKGARPFLLVNSAPYTGGEAGDWWREVAKVSDIVVEVYFTGPRIAVQGPILGSRTLRAGYRTAILNFTRIGVPVNRLGLMLGFQSGPGTGGREGLQPSSAWFELVKLQALAAKQVAGDLKIDTVWSWGWGTFTTAGVDPDKRAAACVYLWARDGRLCDGPAAAGRDFQPSLTEGQLNLPRGLHCTVGAQSIRTIDIARLRPLTGDGEVAFSALYERLVERDEVEAGWGLVLAAESSVIGLRFGGSRSAYEAALARAHASVTIARAVLAEELRRAAIARTLSVPTPRDAAVQAFYAAYPHALARVVEASPAPVWLGGKKRGLALSAVAPHPLFDAPVGHVTRILAAGGVYHVRPLEATLPLSAIPLSVARPAIRAALVSFERAEAFDAWTVRRQTITLNRAVCRGDHLPQVASVDLTTYLPFLSLEP